MDHFLIKNRRHFVKKLLGVSFSSLFCCSIFSLPGIKKKFVMVFEYHNTSKSNGLTYEEAGKTWENASEITRVTKAFQEKGKIVSYEYLPGHPVTKHRYVFDSLESYVLWNSSITKYCDAANMTKAGFRIKKLTYFS